jgi:hypothetical protein
MIDVDSWSAAEQSSLDRGEIVVRSLPTKEKQELAAIGILRITNLPQISMSAFRESLSLRRNDEKIAGGAFSSPPTPNDLSDLALEKGTVAQLQKCVVGKCDLNMPAQMIKRFQSEIDWDSPDAGKAASRLMREMLLTHVENYVAHGDEALGQYDNRRTSVDLAGSHRLLLSTSILVRDIAPEFIDYLMKFPDAKLDNVESKMTWSLVDFGLKPSITLSHTAAYSQQSGDSEQLILASKQIYSSRYLDSSLTFTLLLRVTTATGVDSYLIFSDRSRSDALDGPFGGFARDVVSRESLERIRALLDKAHLKLLAVGKAATGAERGSAEMEESSPSPWQWVLQNRITAATLLAFVLLVLYALWRWKLK